MLLKVLIYWPLLAVATAAFLCRLIHKAKLADRALGIQRQEPRPGERKPRAQGECDDDADRRAA